jgi:predicted histidine transporter YuiF (NhaC family)
MMFLSLARLNVVVALIVGALAGGLFSGLGMTATLSAFTEGLGNGAGIALNYAILGGFAVALSKSGITEKLTDSILTRVRDADKAGGHQWLQYLLYGFILVLAIASQNVIPVHIAFIPILIPPLLHVTGRLKIDRRLLACILTFGLMAGYMFVPIGFGTIFQREVVFNQMVSNGFDGGSAEQVSLAMAIPVAGMIFGLAVAVFWSYRIPREYVDEPVAFHHSGGGGAYRPRNLYFALAAVVLALAVQLMTDTVFLGALAGFLVLVLGGILRWEQNETIFARGMRMMCQIGFIMITAGGFAGVLRATGDIPLLVNDSIQLLGQSKGMAAIGMLLVGLLITMGIGSSFSTVPIIAAIYVPVCIEFEFSPLASLAIVGTAAALGDAGSPSSDSTLGPTMGLNVDGQHSHIWDTVVPTFLHYNLPLLAFGWLAAMIL